MSAKEEIVPESFDGLLEAARTGEREAQGRLLHTCRPVLFRFARKRLRDFGRRNWRESDVVQDTFLKAVEEIQTFQGCTPEQFLAWLRAILDHRVMDLARRSGTEKRDAGLDASTNEPGFQESPRNAAPAADEVAERREQERLLREALGGLPEERARVVRLRYEKLPWEEVGRRMGRSGDAARELHRRAVKALAEALKEAG